MKISMVDYGEITKEIVNAVLDDSMQFFKNIIPLPERDDVREFVGRWYRDSDYYMKRIMRHQEDAPMQQHENRIVKNMRWLFFKTEDFREAKKAIRLYEHDRLETAYIDCIIDGYSSQVRELIKREFAEAENEAMQSIGYENKEEYFLSHGWYVGSTGVLVKPVTEKEKDVVSVLQTFHIERYLHGDRIGYRGKKRDSKDKAQ